jgi:transposase
MISGAKLLKPISDRLHELMLTKDVLHADETTLEVLCEPGRPAQTKSYMWLYKTAKYDTPIVLYDYQEGLSGDFPKRFLNDFKGILHVDGYAGYHKLEPDVKLSASPLSQNLPGRLS